LKGAVLNLSFVDVNGVLIPPIDEPWKDASRGDDASATKDKNYCNSTFIVAGCHSALVVYTIN